MIRFLGKGFVRGEHVADLWMLPNGIAAACEPGTLIISENPLAHGKWQRNESGDWDPAE